MSVQSEKVQRRRLNFSSYDDILAEVRSLASQPTRQLGNWSLGQICDHLAKGIDIAVDGAPYKPSLLIRLVGPFLKKRILRRMSPGFKLPKNASALIPPPTEAPEGIASLEKSIARYQQSGEVLPHFVFGPMTRDEWDQLNFRHAEMHLSHIVPA